MVRRAAKIDTNQPEVVKRFESHGLKVVSTAGMADGFPDLVVSFFNKVNVLVEVKDGEKFPSERQLTPDQVIFHSKWSGWIEIVETLDDVDALAEKIKSMRFAHVCQ